jgi:maltose alpha-D-glucosyltransferase / alpha-amylase
MRIRTHGDLNLGHALYTGKGFVLTGFNGFEAVSVEERRRKRSPLRDLAWMAGSFELAALQRLFDPACVRESDVDAAHPWAMHWSSWMSAAFLKAYLAATASANLLPGEPDSCVVMYQAFALERALRQLQGDLEQAAETTTLSLLGIVRVLAPRPA